MARATQPQILHLALLNPHICSALSPRPGVQPMLCMARQLGCASGQVAGRDQGAVTGISGFAFQGTNAHVIIARCQLWGLFLLSSLSYTLPTLCAVADVTSVECLAARSLTAWRDS